MHIVRCATDDFFGFCLDVEYPAVRIDDRGARNPNFWPDIIADLVGTGHSRDIGARINETRLPERGAGIIGVEGVYTVVLCGHKDRVVELTANVQTCHVEWLRIDLTIHGNREQ